MPYFKLLHITDNLCRTNKNKGEKDLSSLFVKSMFSDGLLENDMIKKEILVNGPDNIEDIYNVVLSQKLKNVIVAIQTKVSEQKQKKQDVEEEAPFEVPKPQEEPDLLKSAIESVFNQYQSLFEKAKIHEVKKISGITRQVVNYFNGYVKRMSGEQAAFLHNKESFVCANVLLSLAKAGAFKLLPNNYVEHDAAAVKMMTLKIDDQGQDIEYCENLLAKPANFLPKKEVKELLISAPLFVPVPQHYSHHQQYYKDTQQHKEEVKAEPEVKMKPPKKHEPKFRQQFRL